MGVHMGVHMGVRIMGTGRVATHSRAGGRPTSTVTGAAYRHAHDVTDLLLAHKLSPTSTATRAAYRHAHDVTDLFLAHELVASLPPRLCLRLDRFELLQQKGQGRAPDVDVRGTKVDVRGNWVDVRGTKVDVKGNSADVRGRVPDPDRPDFDEISIREQTIQTRGDDGRGDNDNMEDEDSDSREPSGNIQGTFREHSGNIQAETATKGTRAPATGWKCAARGGWAELRGRRRDWGGPGA
eukprot:121616-Prorocentrum_minimum.AAC.1